MSGYGRKEEGKGQKAHYYLCQLGSEGAVAVGVYPVEGVDVQRPALDSDVVGARSRVNSVKGVEECDCSYRRSSDWSEARKKLRLKLEHLSPSGIGHYQIPIPRLRRAKTRSFLEVDPLISNLADRSYKDIRRANFMC